MSTQEQRRIWDRNYKLRHKDKIAISKHECYIKHRDKIRIQTRLYRIKHKEEISAKTRLYNYKHRTDTQNKLLELKNIVLTHYGNGKLACVICGYSDNIYALCIDHINGGGTKHREYLKSGSIYKILQKQKYPKGYQTLCMNCNFIKRAENGECSKLNPILFNQYIDKTNKPNQLYLIPLT